MKMKSNYYQQNKKNILKKVKEYREKNKDKIKGYRKKYILINQDKVKQYQKEYRKKNQNYFKKYNKKYRQENFVLLKQKKKEYNSHLPFEKKVRRVKLMKNYYKQNKDKYKYSNIKKNLIKRNNYLKKYYNNNIQYKLAVITRSKINKALRDYINKNKIYKKIEELIGLSIPNYIKYIESKFQEGMNWDNRGKIWNIDHIISIDSFDLKNEIEIKKCFNYLNTRPVLKEDNHYKKIIF